MCVVVDSRSLHTTKDFFYPNNARRLHHIYRDTYEKQELNVKEK